MRVLLIYPDLHIHVNYPVGLGIISSVLKRGGHETKILHFNEELGVPLDLSLLEKTVTDFEPQLIGFSAVTNQFQYVRQMADFIKSKWNIPILVGGIHATIAPEKILSHESVDMICRGEGELAVLELVKKIPQLAPIISQVKGLEQSAYDARAAVTMALGFATSDIGAHHARAWPLAKELEMGKDWGLDEKAKLVIYHQTVRPLFDMLGVCRLPWIELGFDENTYAQFYSAVTGITFNLDELLEKSNELYNLSRAINIKLGVSKEDDYPPERCFSSPIASGPQAGKVLDREDYENLLAIYYQQRGWDENGQPDLKQVAKKFNEKI